MIKNRVLVIGSNGLLGQRVTGHFAENPGVELLCCSIENDSILPGVIYRQLDVTDKNSVRKILKDFLPDVIINCAAFTAVDKCESEKELAWKVNVTGIENIVHQSRWLDSHLIHISSDYIFDGKNGPYSEDDLPNPINYYGRTKLAGENIIKSALIPYTILRTNVVYGSAKNEMFNFLKWVVNSNRKGEVIRIVTDQINNPTFTDDLVFAISRIYEFRNNGVFNIGGKELLSRYEFTLRIAYYFKLNKALIEPIKTSDLNLSAPRPLKSGLLNLKAETELNYKPHDLEDTFYIMSKELDL